MSSDLYLNIQNLTVGDDGTTATGYDPSAIYLVLQGQIGDGGSAAYVDWSTGQLVAISLDDNTVTIGDTTYADYSITLGELIAKSYYDSEKGLPIQSSFYSGRLYVSFNTPIYINIHTDDTGALAHSEPDEGSASDPNYATTWDKFEFTSDKDGKLYSNTTCVDFVGIPFVFSVSGNDDSPQGFELDDEAIKDPFAYVCSAFVADDDFKALVSPARLFAPKVNSPAFAPFGNPGTWLDPYIAYCWAHYHTTGDTITIWNYVNVPAAENDSVASDDDGKSAKWTAVGQMTGGNDAGTAGTLTFTVTSIEGPSPDGGVTPGATITPPTTSFTIPLPSSWDAFRQGGAFDIDPSLTKAYVKAIDGDIKNQVSSALNRNVMHGPYEGLYDTSDASRGSIQWADRDAFYQDNGVPAASLRLNKYSQFLHAISLNGLCYATAYDDKYSQNTNLSVTLSAASPTILTLKIYYKVPASAALPSGSLSTTGLMGGSYTVSAAPDPDDDSQLLLTLASDDGVALSSVGILYPASTADAHTYSKYTWKAAADGSVSVSSMQLGTPFRFIFRCARADSAVEGQTTLIPGTDTVVVYDSANAAAPLSKIAITD